MTSVIGRISTGSYTTKDGDKRFTTEVVAHKVEFLEWADSKESSEAKEPDDEWDEFEGAEVDDDIIPF